MASDRMTPERWRQVTEVFHAARVRDASVRASYLEHACAGDGALRAEVDAMLAAHHDPGGFGDRPVSGPIDDVRRLETGAMLGPYRIDRLIGAGGMGEVYKARDTRLDRTVAIKILPETLAADPQFRERFDREARAISQLTHPHICTLYDVGEQQGTAFLVMEYLEGETLADRLKKGALPLDDGLKVAIQIADALSTAHRNGIVHRDLKPGNVMLTKAGAKLLDFGLAKRKRGGAPAATRSGLATADDALTAEGTIFGTLQYMSPEQVEGKETDARGDIFAFGAMVYEMVTGTRAFEGKSQTSVMARILEHDPPPMSTVQPVTPPALDRVVKRCLAKDPDDRWQTARDVEVELKWIAEGGGQITPRPSAPAHGVRALGPRSLILSTLLLGAGIAGAAIWLLRPASSGGPQLVSRFAIMLPEDQQFSATGRHVVALSPRGTHLVYVANGRLNLRAIDQLSATPIQGTETGDFGRSPFFSPDGQWIAFWQTGELRKVAITGGAPVKLCEAQNPWGLSWGPDDTILYGQGPAGIWRVSGQGGTPQRVVSMDEKKGESAHGPQLLPGGRAVLFTLATDRDWNEAQIVVQSLDSHERKVVLRGGRDARYVETGHLVYGRSGTLLAVPFDLGRLEVTGGPVTLVESVRDSGGLTGAMHFSVSGDGKSLVYVPGRSAFTLVWVDRQGREDPLKAPPRIYFYPRLSPDGTRVALDTRDQESDIWIWDLARETLTRFTFDPGEDTHPVWTPDGQRVLFRSLRAGPGNLFWQAADGTGAVERLTESPTNQMASAVSPDGTRLVFREENATTGEDLMVLALVWGQRAQSPSPGVGGLGRSATSDVRPLVQTTFNELNGEISPDGRWMAYQSNESGQNEIYVRPFPDANSGRWPVSTGGGTRPLWARSGKELFYLGPSGAVMSTSVEGGSTFRAGNPTRLFEGPYSLYAGAPGRTYDVSLDGQRFLMIKVAGPDGTSAPTSIVVVQNWTEELKRLVPTR